MPLDVVGGFPVHPWLFVDHVHILLLFAMLFQPSVEKVHAMHVSGRKPWKGGSRCKKDASVDRKVERRTLRCGVGSSEAVLGATVYSAAMYALMIFAPKSKWTNAIVKSDAAFVPLGLAYGFFLARSWEADTLSLLLPGNLADGFSGGFNPQFFPSLDGIVTVFSRSTDSVASLMLHIQAIGVVVGRYIHLHALPNRTVNSILVLLSMFCTPLAILLYATCKFFSNKDKVRFGREGFN